MITDCPMCHKSYIPELLADAYNNPETRKLYQAWIGGKLIQDAWPSASLEQREQLQTGICSKDCWTALWGGIPDE